ncbi:Heat stress transcription factor A-4b [Apostasia shenzhenica]|uniref:Heat stress transcription factor A-4b n=1 Tax=Apostasia shenzhenica TaxID=1088818 RepID=A0A2I0B9Y2_9ASPA|nr:Heat stress transcription factor A-4b [Apostasia shenzhenica]
MEGSPGGSSSPAPFLTKTYEMLEDASTNSIVSWSSSGRSFVVWNPLEFARDLLPKNFKHSNFSSFIRQLNTYGFRKIDPDQWEFANDEFIRGQRHLLKSIHRRKPIHSHSVPPQGNNVTAPLSESERQELDDEIERLRHEKGSLIVDLQKHAQHQHEIEQQMQSLEERLKDMLLRQRSLVSFLERAVQRPGFLSDLIQQSDLHNKKRRLPKNNFFHEDVSVQDDKNPSLPGLSAEKPDISSMPLLDVEPFEKMESSLNSLEFFFREVGQASGEDAFFDDRAPCLTSVVSPTLMHASSGETDVNMQSSSHNSAEDINSSIQNNPVPARTVQTGIDMNSKPTIHSRSEEPGNAAATVPTGVNDTFWEQFFTESPGSCDTQEAQSERKESEDQRSDGNGWWSRKSVDHLTERMGSLTPAERTS